MILIEIIRKIFNKSCLVFFIIIFTILFGSVIFKGKVLVPGDIPYNTPLWMGEAVDFSYYNAQNYLLSDQINQFYIWRKFVKNSISRGEGIPLWNPYIFAGQPFIANAQSSVFYPPNLLIFFLSPGKVITINAFFNMLILAFFAYLFSMEVGISRSGSLFVSLSLALSGPLILWMGHPHSNVFVWLPLIFWGIEKILKGKKALKYASITGLGLGFSLLGGHPETAFHLFLIAGIYFILRIIGKSFKKDRVKTSAGFILLSLFLGLCIGAIQVFPFAEFLFGSGTLAGGGRGAGENIYFYSENFITNFSTITTMFYPNFYGNPVDRNYYWPYNTSNNYIEQSVYTGFIPFFLFFVSLLKKNKESILKLLIFLAVFSLMLSWRFPGIELFNHLPLFSLVSNGRLKIFFTIIALLISGFGFDTFIAEYKKKNPGSRKKRNFYLILPSISILIFIAFSLFANAFYKTGKVHDLAFRAFYGINIRTLASLLAALTLFFIIIRFNKSGEALKRGLGKILILLSVSELFILSYGFNPVIAEEHILPEISVFKKMKNENKYYRVIADNNIFLPNYNVIFGVPMLGGYDLPVDGSYATAFKTQGGKNIHNHSWNRFWPLSDLLNSGFYIKRGEYEDIGSRYDLFFSSREFTVYKNLKTFPRAFIVNEVNIEKDRKLLLEKILSEKFNLRKTVFLDFDPHLDQYKEDGSKKNTPGTAIIEEYRNDSVEVKTNSETGGILILSDIYSGGWEAEIDGEKTEMFRADFILRGIKVPPGLHRINFFYRPVSFRVGKMLTYAGLILIIIFFFGENIKIKSRKVKNLHS